MIVPDFRPVKIALIGEGQIHGEDDAISMRPYQASLRCSLNDSELLILSRTDFYRTFKASEQSWRNALRFAMLKEGEYISRCKSYLTMNKLVLE